MSSPQPLTNLTVAITRAAHQADAQRDSLEAAGATVYSYPAIRIIAPREIEPLDDALRQATSKSSGSAFDWLVLTSANAVYALAERLRDLSLGPFDGMKVAAIGPSTAEAAAEMLGLSADVLPEENIAEGLAAALEIEEGTRILLPQSAIARPTLADLLREAGAAVTAIDAYRTAIGQGGDDVPLLLWQGQIDAITFTSASTVNLFKKRIEADTGGLAMLQDVVVACIGPVAAEEARRFGLRVRVVPEEYTVEGLTAALGRYFGNG